MDANEQIRMRQSQALRHCSPDVSASGGKAKVTERVRHQARPPLGGFRCRHAANGGTVGESESRQRWNDHVERVRGIAAMARWIGQQRDNLDHLKERARPAMGEKYRQWLRPLAAFMNEVDAEAIDFSTKLRKAIEPCLLRSPVE